MFKSRINDLLAILRGDAEILKETSGTKLKLSESDLTQIKRLIILSVISCHFFVCLAIYINVS